MITQKILKNQKPTDLDIHVKYTCGNCGCVHWLFLKEAQTKNYKIVCDCDTVIKPKTVRKIKVLYETKALKKVLPTEVSQEIPVDLLKKCVTILTGYGFDKEESEILTKKHYKTNPSLNCVDLIKYILKSFGSNDNEQHASNDI